MVIEKNHRCVKLNLPNGRVVDILSVVLSEIFQWVQDEKDKPESGGIIVGYQHRKTGNVSLEEASHPFKMDEQSRLSFKLKDFRHMYFLKKAKQKKSYYMGTWHTHPQEKPIPSSMDWQDWNVSLEKERTGSEYIFFIIIGTKEWRIWAGEIETRSIVEIYECERNKDGLYLSVKDEAK